MEQFDFSTIDFYEVQELIFDVYSETNPQNRTAMLKKLVTNAQSISDIHFVDDRNVNNGVANFLIRSSQNGLVFDSTVVSLTQSNDADTSNSVFRVHLFSKDAIDLKELSFVGRTLRRLLRPVMSSDWTSVVRQLAVDILVKDIDPNQTQVTAGGNSVFVGTEDDHTLDWFEIEQAKSTATRHSPRAVVLRYRDSFTVRCFARPDLPIDSLSTAANPLSKIRFVESRTRNNRRCSPPIGFTVPTNRLGRYWNPAGIWRGALEEIVSSGALLSRIEKRKAR